jgi:hypothetical protein
MRHQLLHDLSTRLEYISCLSEYYIIRDSMLECVAYAPQFPSIPYTLADQIMRDDTNELDGNFGVRYQHGDLGPRSGWLMGVRS